MKAIYLFGLVAGMLGACIAVAGLGVLLERSEAHAENVVSPVEFNEGGPLHDAVVFRSGSYQVRRIVVANPHGGRDVCYVIEPYAALRYSIDCI